MEKAQEQTRSSAVRVVIAEANHMNCQLVERAFGSRRDGVSIAGTAVSSERALDLLRATKAEILVVSTQLQEGPLEGYRLLQQLRISQSPVRAVMLLDSRDRDSVIATFRCGARGVIFRDESIAVLGKCIHAVDQGQVWVNSEHLGYLIDALGRAFPMRLQNGRGVELLSKREEDVVRLVSQGMTNREISTQLRLSEHTVRNYLFRVFDKLGVSTRVELVLYYLQERNIESTELLAS
jgi:DNA-binding NarL/FixJ family response regulator